MRQRSTPKRYRALVLCSIVLTVAYLRSGNLGSLLPSPFQHQWKSTSDDYQQVEPEDAAPGREVSTESQYSEAHFKETTAPFAHAAESQKAKPTPSSQVATEPSLSSISPNGKYTTKSADPPHQFVDKATIVVALSGEMANNLMHIAHGIGLKLLARDLYNIDCNIVLRHHVGPNNRAPKPKWKSARSDIQQCFPKLTNWDFAEGNTPHFKKQSEKQLEWLGKDRYDYLTGLVNANNQTEIEMGLEYLSRELLKDPKRPQQDDKEGSIRLPYMYSQTLDAFPLIDKYYTEIRDLMVFDDAKCCKLVPQDTDYVFHYRNYQSEMPSTRAYEMGFAELSPQKTAKELFGHLHGGRVAITTRIANQVVRSQMEALEQEGIQAYLVEDQTGVQDFCFLKESKVELVGNARSTFVFWAGLLGKVPKARLYHVDNWGLRKRHPNFYERFTYNWTHPELKERIQFELYRAEEMEQGNQQS